MKALIIQEVSECKPSRAQLLDVAFDVVRRYRDFDEYGSKEKACNALRRRCRGFNQRQYQNAFDKAMQLFDLAKNIVGDNIEVIYEMEQTPKFEIITHFEPFYSEMKKQCSGFKTSTYGRALGWILFWHHLK